MNRIEIEFAARLAAKLHRAARELTDLTPTNTRAAAISTSAAAARAPRLTGALARDLRPAATSTTAAVASTLPYVRTINDGSARRNIRGRRFLEAGIEATYPAMTRLYETHVQTTIAKVSGR